MVFKLIKNIFTKSDKKKGNLICNNQEILNDCSIMISGNNLTCVEDTRSVNFDLSDIKDLSLKDKNLYFVHEYKKYKFESKYDITELYTELNLLVSECNELFICNDVIYNIFETEINTFIKVDKKLFLRIIEDKMKFYIKIETEDEILHFEEISPDTQYYMENKTNTFVWSVLKENTWHTFSVIFNEKSTYLDFLSKYVSGTRKNEQGNGVYFEKMEIENLNYEYEDNLFNEDYCSLSEESEIRTYSFKDSDSKNEHLVIGNELAFVTRGSSVGVFKNTTDGLDFNENLSGIMKDPAKKIIAHDSCKSLIYLNKNDTSQLNKIDLNRIDVVETWDLNKNINDYFGSSKIQQNDTLVGLSDYSIFRVDPRTKEKITECKEYKTKNEFLCGMATSKGQVAVASRNGDLRLYDKIDKRAKSLLPGFGDEVTSVDVTTSGQHILCTCKNYLLLYTVDGDYKNKVGKNKPVPKRLTLRPEHLSYINEEIQFTPAKFSTDSNEDSIITSTGKYVIKWNLQDVLAGRIFSYQMSRCSDLVVADNFEFGANDNIIVTMPDDVRSIKGSVLKRPNRKDF